MPLKTPRSSSPISHSKRHQQACDTSKSVSSTCACTALPRGLRCRQSHAYLYAPTLRQRSANSSQYIQLTEVKPSSARSRATCYPPICTSPPSVKPTLCRLPDTACVCLKTNSKPARPHYPMQLLTNFPHSNVEVCSSFALRCICLTHHSAQAAQLPLFTSLLPLPHIFPKSTNPHQNVYNLTPQRYKKNSIAKEAEFCAGLVKLSTAIEFP